jgi:phytoene dehydrogenase-like protein
MMAGSGLLTSSLAFWSDDDWVAQARGRATLEQSFERYAPRIRAGGAFYATDLRKLIESNDFAGIRDALAEPPQRTRDDLQKSDGGVAERARKSGGFSDARVLVAADLLASAFSESSISSKTKKMQGAVQKMRSVVKEMQGVVNETLGEEKGGFFGIGTKKANPADSAKKLRQLYVQGGNAWNEYVFAANENLALQFDKFEFIK